MPDVDFGVSFSAIGGSFLADDFNLINEVIIAPATIPQRSVRKITIASDASNRQNRKVMAAGAAFWTEKTATRTNTINNIIIVTMDFLFLLLNSSV
jgi:hypothetical protein